jgi:putative ABC transport system permease protein
MRAFLGQWAFAWRLLWREWRAGELRVLAASLVVAVAAVTTVGFFTDRVKVALDREANRLLAADLVLSSDHEPDGRYAEEASRRGLSASLTLAFPSMVVRGESSQLAEVKAVGAGYPLRGELLLDDGHGGRHAAGGIPAPGTAWAEGQLLLRLGARLGDELEVGGARLKVTALIAQEPDRAGNLFSIAPRLLLNLADIPATGLVQEGSRVNYRLLLAGPGRGVAAYRAWAAKRLGRGERMEGVRDARPEIRAALERAQKFLGLSSLVAAILAAAAMALAVRRYTRRHWDACALLRTLGSAQGTIFRLYLLQLLFLGLAAGAAGCLIGYGAQWLLEGWLGRLVSGASLPLPLPTFLPALQGMLIGLALLLGFALPPLLRLKEVPALRVLRQELGGPGRTTLAGHALGAAVMAALLIWQAGDARQGLYVLAGLAGVSLLSWGLVMGLVGVLGWRGNGGALWRHGLGNIRRRAASSVWQVAAFGLGLMALLVLTMVRGDLLGSWQATLPPEAPNRFVINIQPDQTVPLRAFFISQGREAPAFLPMVRGRLLAVNGRAVNPADYADERARRLAEREFNLSWSAALPPDNRLVGGRWLKAGDGTLSVEEGIAKTLGLHVGDVLTYGVAGSSFSARISSLRKVEWDSFRVNFFVIAAPGLLEGFPASYITAFYLPPGRERLLDRMVRAFPNLTVIDVAAVMAEVRGVMERVGSAVEFVFLFTLLAGVTVLYAAVAASRDERQFEAAMLRVLGASRKQLFSVQMAEFAGIGALAGTVAALGATFLGWVLAERVFHLSYEFNPWLWLAGLGAGTLGVSAAGLWATRNIARRPPLETLRSA